MILNAVIVVTIMIIMRDIKDPGNVVNVSLPL